MLPLILLSLNLASQDESHKVATDNICDNFEIDEYGANCIDRFYIDEYQVYIMFIDGVGYYLEINPFMRTALNEHVSHFIITTPDGEYTIPSETGKLKVMLTDIRFSPRTKSQLSTTMGGGEPMQVIEGTTITKFQYKINNRGASFIRTYKDYDEFNKLMLTAMYCMYKNSSNGIKTTKL